MHLLCVAEALSYALTNVMHSVSIAVHWRAPCVSQAADATLTAAFGAQLPASDGAEAPLGLMVSQLDGKAGPMQYLAAVEACAGAVPAVLDFHRKAVQSTFRLQ